MFWCCDFLLMHKQRAARRPATHSTSERVPNSFCSRRLFSASVSHQKRRRRNATNAINLEQRRRKISVADPYPVADNGVVAGSTPGPTREIIGWLNVTSDHPHQKRPPYPRSPTGKREIVRPKRRLERVLRNRRTEIDRFRVVNRTAAKLRSLRVTRPASTPI